MASPQTTHVIEIETGIGEPAFIPLTLGQELQPISVGKKGMWKVESPRVLDVHAFFYFDGVSLFVQSADESNAASANGYRVGKAWTELHAPCKIDVGSARLRYRSLVDDAQTMLAPPPPPPPASPSGQLPPTGGPAPSPPMSFPKNERPFKPGAFSTPQVENESTRFAPLDSTGSGRSVPAAALSRPAAGQPLTEESIARAEAARMMQSQPKLIPQAAGSSGQYAAMGGMQGNMGPGGAPLQSGSYPQGYPQPQQGYAAHGGYSNAVGSGSYNSVPQLPGAQGMPQGQLGPNMAPGGYGAMTPQGAMQQGALQQGGPPNNPLQDLLAKAKVHLKGNSLPKIGAGVIFIVASILYLLDDDAPAQKKKATATVDAGISVVDASAERVPPTAPPVAQTPPPWPENVPCPPPNWPAGVPLPCAPNAAGRATSDNTPPPDKNGKDTSTTSEPRGKPLPAGSKTLERQAVDFVAAGDTARAAAAYEELMRRDPTNKVYPEAARILRAKLDGGP